MSLTYIYCMYFIILLCVTLKLFYLSFVPPLAPNPGDATGSVGTVSSSGFCPNTSNLKQCSVYQKQAPLFVLPAPQCLPQTWASPCCGFARFSNTFMQFKEIFLFRLISGIRLLGRKRDNMFCKSF